MGSILSSLLGGGATAEAAAATSSETSSSRILSFHSPARWQLHFNNSKDSSQLVLLLSFLFNLSLFRYLIHFVGFDWMNEWIIRWWLISLRRGVGPASSWSPPSTPWPPSSPRSNSQRSTSMNYLSVPSSSSILFINCLQFCICNYSMFLGHF